MTPLPWYFFMDLGLWAMAVLVIVWAWPKTSRRQRFSACSTAVLVMILQSVNEVLSITVFSAWSFSHQHNRMLGLKFLGQPLEEHLFWWAFAWFIPFFYYGWAVRWPKPAAAGGTNS